MPLPRNRSEKMILQILRREFPQFRCLAPSSIPRGHDGLSYASSRSIRFQDGAIHLAFERSVWNRGFLPSDQRLLDSLALVLSESARVSKEIAQLRGESQTDELTGAYDHRSFVSFLRAIADRDDSGRTAIVYVDVDHLRDINSRYGYMTGDDVLRTVAERLFSLLPSGATLSRVGNDEFAILFDGAPADGTVRSFAAGLLNAVSSPIDVKGTTVGISLSVGISESGPDKSKESLLQEAERRIISSSFSHQGGAAIVPSAGDEMLKVTSAVEDAVRKGGVCNLYVPVFDSSHRRVAALRVVPAIPDGRGGFVDESITWAESERLGVAGPFAAAVLQEAVHDIRSRESVLGGITRLQMTVTRSMVADPVFISSLNGIRKGIGIDCILGRDMLTASTTGETHCLGTLADMEGVRLVADIDGIRLSDIARLKQIRVSFVRVDGVVPEEPEPSSAGLLSVVLAWVQESGMEVDVRNLQNSAMLSDAAHMGASLVEGSVLCNPLSISELYMRMETMGPGFSQAEDAEGLGHETGGGAARDPRSSDGAAANAHSGEVAESSQLSDGNR